MVNLKSYSIYKFVNNKRHYVSYVDTDSIFLSTQKKDAMTSRDLRSLANCYMFKVYPLDRPSTYHVEIKDW